ncbi:MAG: hypothetical protein MUC36_14225 [Planctomycetes bacterium]|jgi:hypothetical protein|nr:hypothetical protein [Planctomycetota bacterium]
MRKLLLVCSTFAFAAAPTAQELRRGIVDADAVVVGRQVGKTTHDADLVLHRVQVLNAVRGGDGAAAVTVLDWPQLALHQRPSPRQSRLYCLQDATAIAMRLGLPAAQGPYFKMVGWPGSNPLIGADQAADPYVRFARLLAGGDLGTSPAVTARELFSTAIGSEPVLRMEATRYLAERPDLRSHLGSPEWSRLLSRATGEIEDVPFKIALAELCGEQRLDGVFDTLMVSLGQVTDVEYARAVGRIGKALHGEDSAARLEARLQAAGQPNDRAALLLALGATNTSRALDALLRMDRTDGAVDAALKEHRSPRARDAVHKKN